MISEDLDTVYIAHKYIVRTITVTNITRITIRATETNGISVGSKVLIFGAVT